MSKKKMAATELSSEDEQRLAQLEDRVSKHIYAASQAVQRTVDKEARQFYETETIFRKLYSFLSKTTQALDRDA